MPRFGTLHIERNLTNYSQRYNNPNFVNERLFPSTMVKFEADKYIVYGMEHFNLYETLRANGAESTQVDWTFSEASYFAEEHSLRDIVTDRDRANADKPLTLDVDTLELVTDGVMLRKEYAAAEIARNTANYANGNTSALSGTSQWSDYANSTPLDDFKTMQQAVFNASRVYPNTIVLPYSVAITLAYHPTILELVKYNFGPNGQAMLQQLNGGLGEGLLPNKLFGMDVVVAGAAYNTANPGQQDSLSDVWGTDVVIAYVEKAPKLKSLSYGKTFRTEKYVRKWREESRHGDWVEYNDIYDLALTASATGYLLQTVIA
ncbi:hypothetical protein [Alicyclobacillus ferrooxydans]|uniref:Capsid protein n=1 Tax=Alicyclobacillus ferrooxydans TaxID=471514 RepID=A0A0P9EHC5_9BACL|nr:hypothetical protein [Alicyclobacillus ferrooxydans]KPV42016.1 hypothetical protein AN477_19805 [Alicyclobacillus ferrooxydans]